MLHFLHMRGWDIAASPVGHELRRLGVRHEFVGTPLDQSPVSGFAAVRSYVGMLWRITGVAWRSLVRARPRPEAVMLSSHIEALVFGVLRLALRAPAALVLQTVILTPRRSPLANAAYMLYWRCVMSLVDAGICHARAEAEAFERSLPGHAHKLAVVPYGTTVTRRSEIRAAARALGDGPVVVSAGRSGRDYPTLVRAVAGLPCRLVIICDADGPTAGIAESEQVTVLRSCFGDDYLRLLASADAIALPLAVDDISVGQMVLLQAAALGRPVIVTRTSTTVEYARDGWDALLVDMGDDRALRDAIARLIGDPALQDQLGRAASAKFDRSHTTEAYVQGLVRVAGAAVLRLDHGQLVSRLSR